ncbi:DNA phosphorothioation system sulfurtransferase DndC [Halanaerobium congolense]|jgi:DNA sulfur modification protein DndC|uniref:DNA sulfur modification protein DndC n=1 Tax=Halanaerobium congolense TaxID=54121 RepID=A0A4R7DVA8_9FIRM|nr:DNA phosphorothioation system sulfurtransferase DndC [Halanaerobium congolense]TDS26203.1 DNA sulfur modification protein DndC [Halanaerobium congolense]SDK99925.1 DNA sulfur modification protein DndC [Halanaerobium congolense]SDN05432.1 DNA sulfur modification protein DndC [Halanaerobium congolense]
MNFFNGNKVKDILTQIQEQYLEDNRPWIVGYSGGKDSSTVTQLIFLALNDLKEQNIELNKDVYIISADTLVETPMIINFIADTLNDIQEKAEKIELPIKSQLVRPKYKDSFWTLLIGKGYPTPRQKFRWCTDRLKIQPTTDFIKNKLSEHDEAIVVLGVRKGESASRDQVLNNSKIKGQTLRRHQSLNNAYVYSPIEEFDVDDVWHFLLRYNNGISPWDSDNNDLYELYRESDSECPMVVDKNTSPCGESRFGCWVCTVVQEDKSIQGFIQAGEEWLRPLAKFRRDIMEMREDRDKREKKRSNGAIYSIEREGKKLRGLGPFTLEARKEILEELLKVEKKVADHIDYPLIRTEELKLIRKEWINSGDWNDSLPKIYKKIYNKELPWAYDNNFLLDEEEINLITELCQKEDINIEILKRLISLESQYTGQNYRYNIYKKINKILHQDWIHYDEIRDINNGSDISEIK